MPTTPREVLTKLVHDVAALTKRIELLETLCVQADPWDEPMELDRPPTVADDNPQAITMLDGNVTFAEPNAQQVAMRAEWVDKLGLENLPKEHGLDHEAAKAAYRSGGPMWLYLFDREFVTTLPPECRRAMVEDVLAGGGQREAIEMGRDLMKLDLDGRRAAENVANQIADGYRPAGSMTQE